MGLERKGSYLDQHCPIELSTVMEVFCSALSITPATNHMLLLSTWNVASESKELNFNFSSYKFK